MAGVGTRKVYENDKVSIWEFFLEPGETLERHTHQRDYLFYVIEGSEVEISNAEGSKVMNLRSGETYEFRIERGRQLRVGARGSSSAGHPQCPKCRYQALPAAPR